MNYSRQREALINVLKSTKSHPTAEWIYTELRKEYPKISMGTVYRNLAKLTDSGDILKLSVGDVSEHYDGFTHEHYHFVCTECKSVTDVDLPFPSELDDMVSEAIGAKTQSHSLVFYGKCKKCK